jgi:hypothetical protein
MNARLLMAVILMAQHSSAYLLPEYETCGQGRRKKQ